MEKRNPTVEPSPPHRSAAPLKVHLLGRFEVIRGDLPIPAQSWRRRRPADLLKLIALAPGGSLPRERVFELLWPGKDSASGANNLHRALYDLRHVLDGRWIDLEQGQVRLHPEVWVDVVAFESAVAARDPSARQTAVALYGGELSPEDRESAWLAQRRLDLRRLFAQAAFPLARAAVARGDAAAVPLLRRILEGEPATEEAHQLLMRALVDSGQRADALRQFDACEAALRVLGGGPGSETRALREAILQGSVGPVRARTTYDGYLRASRRLLGTSDPPPLRGRAAALVLLQSMVEQGSGVLVLLGERGVGKTRLALEGARIAQERGALVLAGLVGGTITGPCAPFADAWSDYRRATGLGGEDPFAEYVGERNRTDDVKRRIQEDALRLLIRAGGGRPIYLLLEDIHGADEPSLNLLHYLARSARGAGLMLVATCREDEVHSGAPIQMALSHLDCERLARGIRVQRLDLEATRLQITDILGEAPRDALAAQIYRITDGSPFYTEEMARAFKESGQLAPAQNPTAAVCARVARLGPAVEAVLSAAAVAGQRFDFAVVSMASGLPRDEALRALDVCLAGRLLEEDGAGCHFHHSLVREALYEGLPQARRVELHRAVADVIEAQAAASPTGIEGAAEALAHHRSRSEEPEKAFSHLLSAGHRAGSRTGLREALGFFEQALAIVESGRCRVERSVLFELLEATGRAQLGLGDLAGVARTFEAAAGLRPLKTEFTPSSSQRALAMEWSALGFIAGGNLSAAEERLMTGLAGAVGPKDERSGILHLLSELRWHAGDYSAALEAAQRSTDEAHQAGDGEMAQAGRDLAALAQRSLGVEPAAFAPASGTVRCHRVFDVHLAFWERDLAGDRPRRQIEAGVALYGEWARRRRSAPGEALARTMEGALALASARWDLAEAALRDAVVLQRSSGSALAEAFTLERLGILLTARGRVEEGMSVLAEGVIAAERGALRRHGLTRLNASLARNRLVAGAVYAAEDCIRQASETAARHGDCAVCDAHFRPAAIRVALARGRIGDAEAESAQLEAIAVRRGGRVFEAIARAARAQVLAAQGRWHEAHSAAEEARQVFLSVDAVFEAARCLIIESQALRARAATGPDDLLLANRVASAAAEVFGPFEPPSTDT